MSRMPAAACLPGRWKAASLSFDLTDEGVGGLVKSTHAEIITSGPPVHSPGLARRRRTRGPAVAALHARTAPAPRCRVRTRRGRVSAYDPAHGTADDRGSPRTCSRGHR